MDTKKKMSKKPTLLLILVPEIQTNTVINTGPRDTECLYYQLNVVSATLKGSLLVQDKNKNNNNDKNFHQHSFYMPVSILHLANKKI